MEMTTKVTGHVLIKDAVTQEVLLDKMNKVHPKNMAITIANGLANYQNHQIFKVALGNGGTIINSEQKIVYLEPLASVNASGSATLYNETYSEIVDDLSGQVSAGNSVISQQGDGNTAIVTCTIQLRADEPNSSITNLPNGEQAQTDSQTTDTESPYTFDELGLKTENDLLLTHIIFNPIEKNAQRELIISYTLTISVS